MPCGSVTLSVRGINSERYYTFLTINSSSGPAPCDDAQPVAANEVGGEDGAVGARSSSQPVSDAFKGGRLV